MAAVADTRTYVTSITDNVHNLTTASVGVVLNTAPLGADVIITIGSPNTNFVFGTEMQSTYVDADPIINLYIKGNPLKGSLLYNGVEIAEYPFRILYTNEGLLTYVPPMNLSGINSDYFFYCLQDQGDVPNFVSDTYRVQVDITSGNQEPTSSNNSTTIAHGAVYVFGVADFTLGYSDPEGDSFAHVEISSLPVSGSLKVLGVVQSAVPFTVTAAALGTGDLTYEDDSVEIGAHSDAFSFSIFDNV